jgi:anti-sigma factor RsiW
VNCDVVLERIAAGDRLTGRPTPEIDAHLAVCPDCRMRAPAAEALRRKLRDSLLWEEPPVDLGQRVVDAVTGNVMSRPARFRWWLAAAVAALVALVLGLGWLTGRPDWSVELVAGPDAPGAEAVVAGWNTGQGTRMVFDVTGLEDAPDGFYYEVWLTASNGRHVSAGTFRSPGRFEVMAGVRRRDFPRIWVTLEPADSDSGPYDVMVLDSTGVGA